MQSDLWTERFLNSGFGQLWVREELHRGVLGGELTKFQVAQDASVFVLDIRVTSILGDDLLEAWNGVV